MLSFQNPAAFLLILVLPAFFVLRRLGFFEKLKITGVLSDWGGKTFEWHDPKRAILQILSRILFTVSFLLCVCALADPVLYKQDKVYTSLGTDLIFVMDTSPSMAATEGDGNTRLESCKKAVAALAMENTGARMGIVAMASQSAVIVPPTIDQSVILNRLSSKENGQMGDGTAIGTGISTAVFHLISSKAPRKVIVLFTDGENNAGEIHPQTAAALCKDHDISLYILGVGSKGSVPIEYTDPNTGKKYSGYLNSDFDSNELRKIALSGDGKYYEMVNLADLSKGLSRIINDEAVSQNWTYKARNTNLYERFLLWALIFTLSYFVIKRLLLQEVL